MTNVYRAVQEVFFGQETIKDPMDMQEEGYSIRN